MCRRSDALSLVNWPRIERIEEEERSRCGQPDLPDCCFSLPIRGPRDGDCRAFHPLFRRFVCACCRELGALLVEPDSRAALDLIERFAYRQGPFEDLVLARRLARHGARRVAGRDGRYRSHMAARAVLAASSNSGTNVLGRGSTAAYLAGLSIRRQAEVFERVAAEWVAEVSEERGAIP